MRRCSSIIRPGHTRAGGFTLMELMLTLVLGAILMAVAVPMFNGMTANNRLASQSNDFISIVNFARSEAITRNTTVTICRADAETDTDCATDDEDWHAWIVRNAAGEVLRSGTVNTFGDLIHVTSDLSDQTISFQSDGLARTAGGLVSDKKMWICTTQDVDQNFRIVTFGAGSRLSVTKAEDTCP
jgi:type IV fimbrial biogenesis protein FimT